MRIGISGTQNIGKSTMIKDFLQNWGMYETQESTYREVLLEKGLDRNKDTTPETQTVIMNHLCDQIMGKTIEDNIITDRTPYDALIYSMYQHEKGVEGFTEEFINTQIMLAREASTFYDIIFHIPIVKDHDIPLEEDGLRDIDPEYRIEIDNIFSAMFKTYYNETGPFFKFGDCPAVIEVWGTPEERMEMLKLYLTEDGNAYGEDDSLIADALGGDIVGGDVPEIII